MGLDNYLESRNKERRCVNKFWFRKHHHLHGWMFRAFDNDWTMDMGVTEKQLTSEQLQTLRADCEKALECPAKILEYLPFIPNIHATYDDYVPDSIDLEKVRSVITAVDQLLIDHDVGNDIFYFAS
jgi:hypothetical protein